MARLNRESVIDAALELLNETGIDGLSMIFKKSTTMIIEKYSTEYLKNNLNLDV